MINLKINTDYKIKNILYYLCAVIIFINPLLEAPKNIVMIILLFAAIYSEVIKKQYQQFGKWDLFFFAYILSCIIGIPLAAYATHFGVVTDVLRYTIFGWIIYRSNFNEKQKIHLVCWATSGTVIALFYGAYSHYIMHEGDFWTLKSVGHVNHAAIYNAIIACMALVTLLSYWKTFTSLNKFLWLLMLLFCLAYIILGESRATFAAVFALFFIFAIIFGRKNRALTVPIVALVTIIITVSFVAKIHIFEKQQQMMEVNNILSDRDTIWQAGINTFKAHPWFGIGKKNYRMIPIKGSGFINENDHTSHAHNIYINTLVEGGIWAFFWLMLLFIGVGFSLFKYFPGHSSDSEQWANWGWCFSGLAVTLIVGLVNTTFHHEHANLIMFCSMAEHLS